MESDLVIDADGHVIEEGVNWQERLDVAFRERAPQIYRDSRNRPRILIGHGASPR